jgi:Family of unknown function (DUF5309)
MALPVMSPAPANTYIETTAPNVREDLADIIYQIDKDETPMVSMLDSVGADQVMTEWLLQELYPAANVPQPEGFTAAMSPAKKPLRLNNICQILARTVSVSDTLRVVQQVGEEEYARQLLLRGQELKRDLELAVCSESVKTIADPRALAGFQTWCTVGSVGAGAGVLPIGDGTNGHTPGTARDLTISLIEDCLQANFNNGEVPTAALMSANIKRYFSVLAATTGAPTTNPIVQQNILMSSSAQPVTMNGAVDVYRSNFGELQLIPDRFIPAHVIELVNRNFIELAPLPNRDMVEQEYGKVGDSTQGGIVWEGTLRVTAPKAQATVWDLNQ